MTNKAHGNAKSVAKGITVKFVKRANMWVATYPKAGKNAQEWFVEEPTREELNKLMESTT